MFSDIDENCQFSILPKIFSGRDAKISIFNREDTIYLRKCLSCILEGLFSVHMSKKCFCSALKSLYMAKHVYIVQNFNKKLVIRGILTCLSVCLKKFPRPLKNVTVKKSKKFSVHLKSFSQI